jgi:hypothetical protein
MLLCVYPCFLKVLGSKKIISHALKDAWALDFPLMEKVILD